MIVCLTQGIEQTFRVKHGVTEKVYNGSCLSLCTYLLQNIKSLISSITLSYLLWRIFCRTWFTWSQVMTHCSVSWRIVTVSWNRSNLEFWLFRVSLNAIHPRPPGFLNWRRILLTWREITPYLRKLMKSLSAGKINSVTPSSAQMNYYQIKDRDSMAPQGCISQNLVELGLAVDHVATLLISN